MTLHGAEVDASAMPYRAGGYGGYLDPPARHLRGACSHSPHSGYRARIARLGATATAAASRTISPVITMTSRRSAGCLAVGLPDFSGARSMATDACN